MFDDIPYFSLTPPDDFERKQETLNIRIKGRTYEGLRTDEDDVMSVQRVVDPIVRDPKEIGFPWDPYTEAPFQCWRQGHTMKYRWDEKKKRAYAIS